MSLVDNNTLHVNIRQPNSCVSGQTVQLGLNTAKFSKGLSTDTFEPSVKINLTKELRGTFYRPDEIRALLAKYPYVSRRVGTLPPELAQKVGNGEKLESFDAALTDFAANFTAKNGEVTEDEVLALSAKLSEIIDETVQITDVGGGKNGYGYKILTKEKDIFFKCFYDKSSNPLMERAGHGNFAEIAAALYSQKAAPDKFVKFYMGKLGENNDGYMLTEFVADKGKMEQSKFSFKELINKFVSNDPNSANKRNGKFIDFGMSDPTEYDKMNPLAYKILKNIMIALDEGSEKNMQRIVAQYSGKPEYEEAIAKVEEIILKKFNTHIDDFSSRKDLFEILGLDYKPELEKLAAKIGKGMHQANLEAIAKCYGISAEELKAMISPYFDNFKNIYSNNSQNK